MAQRPVTWRDYLAQWGAIHEDMKSERSMTPAELITAIHAAATIRQSVLVDQARGPMADEDVEVQQKEASSLVKRYPNTERAAISKALNDLFAIDIKPRPKS